VTRLDMMMSLKQVQGVKFREDDELETSLG